MLERYPPDTRVWIPDSDLGWISAKVVSSEGEVALGSAFEVKIVDEHGKVCELFHCS